MYSCCLNLCLNLHKSVLSYLHSTHARTNKPGRKTHTNITQQATMFMSARLSTPLTNFGRHAFKASPAVAVEGNVLGSSPVLDGNVFIKLGTKEKEQHYGSTFSSRNLLPAGSKSAQSSSMSCVDPSVNSHARPVKNVFAGAMMRAPTMATTLRAYILHLHPHHHQYSNDDLSH